MKKMKFIDRVKRMIQMPGAILSLVLFSIAAVIGATKNESSRLKIRDGLFTAIPWIALVFWLSIGSWVAWKIWN